MDFDGLRDMGFDPDLEEAALGGELDEEPAWHEISRKPPGRAVRYFRVSGAISESAPAIDENYWLNPQNVQHAIDGILRGRFSIDQVLGKDRENVLGVRTPPVPTEVASRVRLAHSLRQRGEGSSVNASYITALLPDQLDFYSERLTSDVPFGRLQHTLERGN